MSEASTLDGDGTGSVGTFALFLDFDGTLVDIVDTPDAVIVEPDLPGVLATLKDRLRGALAIVTGREISSVDQFLRPGSLDICGMHGLESRVDGVRSEPPPGAFSDLIAALPRLRRRFGADPGILIEEKAASVAIHWRLSPAAEPEVRDAARELVADLGAGYRVQPGKALVEIVSAQSGKGGGIARLLEHPAYRGRCPVFAGDDVTDEAGFERVNTLDGISIKVGPGPTVASRRVADPAAFRDLLRSWAEGPIDPSGLSAA